jgi:hypothetical protein
MDPNRRQQVPNELKDDVLAPDLDEVLTEFEGDLALDPRERQRDRNAHLLLTAWKMIMENEAEEKSAKH